MLLKPLDVVSKLSSTAGNPDEIVPALQQNRHVLWKIHGDWRDRRTRILSEQEYEKHYEELRILLGLALTNRPALFLGSSLDKDRTVEILAEIRRSYQGVSHFAILQAPSDEQEFDERVKEIRRLGIAPIWYPEHQHTEVEQWLAETIDSLAYRLSKGYVIKEKKLISKENEAETARFILKKEIEEMQMSLEIEAPQTGIPFQERPPYAPMLDQITKGQIIFFLGAGACLDRLPLSRQFYEDLAKKFDNNWKEIDSPRIAQHFADKYGREALYTQVREFLIQSRPPQPTAIHWFLATLHKRLQAKGYDPETLLILTTNYDDWMERALNGAGERYHMFSYRAGNPHKGQLVYRDPDGGLQIVERPFYFRQFSETCTILFKFHGGQHLDIDLPVTYVFTHRDFIDLAKLLPEIVPWIVFDRLKRSPLLFLGHRLQDDSVESLMRELNIASPARRSWAIQIHPIPEWRTYWKEIKVEIIDSLLQTFIIDLDKEVEKLLPARQSWERQ